MRRRDRCAAAYTAARLIFWSAVPLLVVAAWLNSYVMGDWVQYYDPARPLYIYMESDAGLLSLDCGDWTSSYDAGWDSSFHTGIHGGRGSNPPGPLGWFAFERVANGRRLALPYWFVALTAAVPATLVWRGHLRELRSRRLLASNKCANCGYDLRATPGRCPECGAVFETDDRGVPIRPPSRACERSFASGSEGRNTAGRSS